MEQKEILGIQASNTLPWALTVYCELVLLISVGTGMSRELRMGDLEIKKPKPNKAMTNG